MTSTFELATPMPINPHLPLEIAASKDRQPVPQRVQRRSGVRSHRHLLIGGGLLVASLIAFLPLSAASPKLATIGQVGPPIGANAHFVLLLWQPIDGYEPGPAHAIYRKAGPVTSLNPFSLLAVVQPTADEPTLNALLQNAAQAGFDLLSVEQVLDSLAGGIAPGTSLADKLSWALSGNLAPEAQQMLQEVVVRQLPTVAIAAGRGYLATVNASELSTFEIREFDLVNNTAGQVLGRVTTGLAPALMPAPANLSERVETTPQGHLRVMLRWCSPNELLKRMLHVSGFNVYRADRAAWQQAQGTPPPLNLNHAALLQSLNQGLLAQVNRSPITPELDQPCDVPPADDLFFIADDNDHAGVKAYEPGGIPFVAGDQYTYYTLALDHFGRPGHPSPGLEIVVCDRMPPQVPKRLQVENLYRFDDGTGHTRQHLDLSWQRDDPAEVAHYWIYRWDAPADALEHADNPTVVNRLARIPNVGISDRIGFVDDGTQQLPGAPPPPTLPTDAGRTIWYTVRAEDDTPCKFTGDIGNLSGPSAPAYGVLRDWSGPANPSGRLRTRCCDATVSFSADTSQLSHRSIRLLAGRGHPAIAWVEWRETGALSPVSRFEFSDAVPVIETTVDLTDVAQAQFEARFGTFSGAVSIWQSGGNVSESVPVPLSVWTGSVNCELRAGVCVNGFIDPVDPDTGEITGVCGEVSPAPGAVEWRILRRVGFTGPLIQIASGTFPENSWCDSGAPAAPSALCYFLQCFDQDGNPSVIAPLGCAESLGTGNLPKPVVTSAQTTFVPGPAIALVPGAAEWFCPRPGVERFEIAIRPPPPGSQNVTWLPVPGAQEAIGTHYGIFLSPRLPAGFGGDGTAFDQAVPLLSGVQYEVRIRAIRTTTAANGDLVQANGVWSDEVPFTLALGSGEPPGPEVPWPARPVPAINPAVELFAEFDAEEQLGRVELGIVPRDLLISEATPTAGLPATVFGESLEPLLVIPLPFVVYRHDTSPNRRAEMTQISHFVDQILTEDFQQNGQPALAITDGLFMLKRRNNDPAGLYRLWIRDTQPVIGGHHYRYTIVRHGSNREIVEVLASTQVEVPL